MTGTVDLILSIQMQFTFLFIFLLEPCILSAQASTVPEEAFEPVCSQSQGTICSAPSEVSS